MIRPPGRSGVAFTESADGDQRHDHEARRAVSHALDISSSWATVSQVHGGSVVPVSRPGSFGEADALWTTVVGLPLAVFTADCFGVVLHAPEAVGVAHVGWRGVTAGVVNELRSAMSMAGHTPTRSEMGPGIGPCCFEVGHEVAEQFPGFGAQTTWNTVSVDLVAAIREQLPGLDLWSSVHCTMHQKGWYSHRANRTRERLAAIGWRP